jgi:hypothetical protein
VFWVVAFVSLGFIPNPYMYIIAYFHKKVKGFFIKNLKNPEKSRNFLEKILMVFSEMPVRSPGGQCTKKSPGGVPGPVCVLVFGLVFRLV